MHTSPRITPSAHPPLSLLSAAAITLTALALFTGCKQHADDDDHDHDHPAATTPPAPGNTSHAHESHDDHDDHEHSSGGAAAHTDEVTLTPDAIERANIRLAPAQLHQLHPTVNTPARVAFNAEAMAHVGSPLRGRAVEVKVKLGDFISHGQELVIVESAELGEAQADFLQKRAAAHAAGPAAELAKSAWERAKGLYEQSQGVSLTEVQRRELEYKSAAAAVSAAQSSALSAQQRLRLMGMSPEEIQSLTSSGELVPRYAIKAPIQGQVVQREITLGELVSPDRDSLLVLADTRTLWVLADVPESQLIALRAGAKAWITSGSRIGEDTQRFEGAVAFIAPLVDPTTRTAQVRIELSASSFPLKPGMFAQAELSLALHDDSAITQILAVPDEAIQTIEGGPAVFVPVPSEPNTFAARPVTIGKRVGTLIPITSGLTPGESIVISGTFILKAELGKGSAAHEH